MGRLSSSLVVALACLACAVPVGAADAAPASEREQACLAGAYEASAMEIAAGLYLHADGRYDFALVYGALDEQSAGSWTADRDAVYLTSDAYVPPRIAVAGQRPVAGGGFTFLLDLPAGASRQYFDVEVQQEDGQTASHQMGEEGLALSPGEGERPVAVRLVFPLLDLASPAAVIAPGSGAEVRFRFEPNDAGKVSFEREALPRVEGGGLRFERHGRVLVLRTPRPGCKRQSAP